MVKEWGKLTKRAKDQWREKAESEAEIDGVEKREKKIKNSLKLIKQEVSDVSVYKIFHVVCVIVVCNELLL